MNRPLMNSYLLDTNHCSQVIQGDQPLLQTIRNRADQGAALSVIVRGELLYMAHNSEQQQANLERVRRFLEYFDIYPINIAISDIYAALKANLLREFGPKERAKRRKTKIQDLGFDDNDLWIAATAIHYGLILVSTDSDFTRIQQVCNLVVESWL